VLVLRAVAFAAFGLAVGSFLTVVIHRVPRRESIVAPRSACPSCGNQIGARDNIPVVSYLLLGGRCRHCRAHISAEYPFVESLTAGMFLAAALLFGDVWIAAMVAAFLAVVEAAAAIDLRHRVIPNRILYPSLAAFAVVVVTLWAAGRRVSLWGAVLGLVAYGGGLLLIALASRSGMGMGDVKLAGLVGLVLGALGWKYVGVAVALGILAGGLVAVGALLRGARRKDVLPFGPSIALGALLSVLFAPHLAAWYTSSLH
jgi:leader peptidase (prepilin peptidase)/N-methyltransferase